jgi:metal transporter CNNM
MGTPCEDHSLCPDGLQCLTVPQLLIHNNLPDSFMCVPHAILDPEMLPGAGVETALSCTSACFGPPEPIHTSDLLFTFVLLCLSGLFSGLTLGLMSLDLAQLRIVISGGSREEAGWALKIFPLRRKGNLLLCTLLIGNTLVNAMIAIVSASFTGGVAGTILSTGFIVVFGEISPQSLCSRHGLRIGAATVPIVRIFLAALFPVAWPISIVLDHVLGEEMGTIYSKKELSVLMEMHVRDQDTPLTVRDQEIFTGMMKMSELAVRNVMTPLCDVYMLEERGTLTFDTMLEIYRKGYTRIPVYRETKSHIIGLLYTKDLIMVDPEDDLPVDRVLEFCSRELLSVDSDTSLDLMFQQVESGRSHLYFVQNELSEIDTATDEVRELLIGRDIPPHHHSARGVGAGRSGQPDRQQ